MNKSGFSFGMLPKLLKLKLKFGAQTNFMSSVKSWPSLQYLSINYPSCDRISNLVCEFLRQNTQITILKLKTDDALEKSIKTIAENLPNIPRLSINSKNQQISVEIFRPLKVLKNLTKFSVINELTSMILMAFWSL